MRVYGLTLKGLEFGRVDAAFGAGENAASLLALKHPRKIKLVAVADVLGQRRPVIIGFGAIRINDHRPIVPLPRINRNRATFLERVYPVVNILTMFFTWGVSHA